MRIKSACYALSALCALALSTARAETSFVLGPLDTTRSPTSLSVLGQSFAVTPDTVCALRGALATQAECFSQLADFAYIAIESDPRRPSDAATILVLADRYVPGASTVKVIGRITARRASLGVSTIETLSVDQTSLSQTLVANPQVGALVEIVGTQPLYGGVVLAQSLANVKSPTTQIIVGTGRAALADSTDIIVGTGRSTGSEVSTNVIVGTGKAKPVEASTNIIVGTGRNAASGPSTNIIVGTGKSNAASASTNIIVGTGRSVASSPSTNIIVGTGKANAAHASTNIIVGTGRSVASAPSTNIIVGTGRR